MAPNEGSSMDLQIHTQNEISHGILNVVKATQNQNWESKIREGLVLLGRPARANRVLDVALEDGIGETKVRFEDCMANRFNI